MTTPFPFPPLSSIPPATPNVPPVAPASWNAPFYPSLPMMAMPTRMLDGLINNYGVRLGWMKGHSCPCVWGSAIPGSPDPNCVTCSGRGYYWDKWSCPFMGLLTFLPDEPGQVMNDKYGTVNHAEPTLSIPHSATEIWTKASSMDAYVEIDGIGRYNSVLIKGENSILPYQQGLTVEDAFVYNLKTKTTTQLKPSQFTINGAQILLDDSFEDGTAYTVEYSAAPVYLAWREAGGLPHSRPFAAGTGQIPKRFRIITLDLWTRSRGLPSTTPQTDAQKVADDSIYNNFGRPIETSPQAIL